MDETQVAKHALFWWDVAVYWQKEEESYWREEVGKPTGTHTDDDKNNPRWIEHRGSQLQAVDLFRAWLRDAGRVMNTPFAVAFGE